MSINLLPWRELKIQRHNRQYCLWLLLFASILSMTIMGTHGYLLFLQRAQKTQNGILSNNINHLPMANKMDTDANKLRILQQYLTIVQTSDVNQTTFWKQLTLLQRTIPDEIQLTHIDWLIDQLQLQGDTFHPEQISQLVKSLEQSQFFTAVTLNSMEQSNDGRKIRFSLQAKTNPSSSS